MLLRRVIEHVKTQNWTAVAIDFVIVVVGVFVGLQVSNWNVDRFREQTEQTYINRIREDLAANREDFQQRAAYYKQAQTNALAALAVLDAPPESIGDQFLVDIYQASQALPRELGRDTYDEILSAGGAGAISDVSIRKRLANFYRGNRAASSRMRYIPPYREIIRQILPYHVQAAIRAACNDQISTGENGEPKITLPAQCEPALSPEQTAEAVQIVLDYDIRRDLNRLLSDLENKLSSAQLVIDRVNLLDNFLEQHD